MSHQIGRFYFMLFGGGAKVAALDYIFVGNPICQPHSILVSKPCTRRGLEPVRYHVSKSCLPNGKICTCVIPLLGDYKAGSVFSGG